MPDESFLKTPEEIAHDIVAGAIKKKDRGHLSRLRRHFLAGLLVLTPLVLTVWIVGWVVHLVDGNTRDFLKTLLGDAGTIWFSGKEVNVVPVGFGLLLVFVLTCFVGMVASNFVGKRIILLMDGLIRRVPGVSWIYNVTHQVSHAFLNRNKDLFRQVIYVEYPRRGIYSIGFVTNYSLPGVKTTRGEDLRTVFIPTTPNPTSGYLLLIPESECVPCLLSVEEAMKLIISGGVVIPDILGHQETTLPLLDEVKSVGSP